MKKKINKELEKMIKMKLQLLQQDKENYIFIDGEERQGMSYLSYKLGRYAKKQ